MFDLKTSTGFATPLAAESHWPELACSLMPRDMPESGMLAVMSGYQQQPTRKWRDGSMLT
jgi:hypothetical protein